MNYKGPGEQNHISVGLDNRLSHIRRKTKQNRVLVLNF